jgi:hypothetical protein
MSYPAMHESAGIIHAAEFDVEALPKLPQVRVLDGQAFP